MNLIAAANRSFDPDEIDTGDVEPRVSAAEAIRIVQLHGGGKARREGEWQTLEEQAAEMGPDDIEELRARLIRKLERMELRERPKRLAEGWSRDDEHETMVPPGWTRKGE
ncbi:MAG: hypothetical protein ABIR63_03610 [Sphingomicrobium sp.]